MLAFSEAGPASTSEEPRQFQKLARRNRRIGGERRGKGDYRFV
jgi:hypothetical protein